MKTEIVKIGSKILNTKTEKVKIFDKNLRKIVQKMKEIMIKNGGVGISANQIGLNLAISIAKPEDKFYVFINPEIQYIGEQEVKEEGCLSVPDKFGIIKRYDKIKIKYQDIRGKLKSLTASGILAHIIQHEIDHINGVLFVDKAMELYKIENSKNEKG